MLAITLGRPTGGLGEFLTIIDHAVLPRWRWTLPCELSLRLLIEGRP